MAESAEFVRRCQSVVAGIQCGREESHGGRHEGERDGVKATWTERMSRPKRVRP